MADPANAQVNRDMEIILLIGIQASGKSTFYLRRFFETHVRISRDMLRTARRERILSQTCFHAGQRFVVDKCNVTRAARAEYIALARAHGFRVVGYYFEPDIEASLARNATRTEKNRIPAAGVYAMLGRLQPPTAEEGFDELYRVSISQNGTFIESPWHDQCPDC